MKKLIPFVCTFLYSLFAGFLLESLFLTGGYMGEPFRVKPFLFFLGLSFLSALVITVIIIVNAAYLINLDNRRKVKKIVAIQILVFIVPFFCFWSIWHDFFREIYYSDYLHLILNKVRAILK